MKRTRKAAIQAGETRYSTGKPCKYGHMTPRYTINTLCVECQLERLKKQQAFIKAIRQLKAQEKVG